MKLLGIMIMKMHQGSIYFRTLKWVKRLCMFTLFFSKTMKYIDYVIVFWFNWMYFNLSPIKKRKNNNDISTVTLNNIQRSMQKKKNVYINLLIIYFHKLNHLKGTNCGYYVTERIIPYFLHINFIDHNERELVCYIVLNLSVWIGYRNILIYIVIMSLQWLYDYLNKWQTVTCT